MEIIPVKLRTVDLGQHICLRVLTMPAMRFIESRNIAAGQRWTLIGNLDPGYCIRNTSEVATFKVAAKS